MPLDSWLPVDFELPDKVKLKNVLFEGLDWQIYNVKGGDRALVVKETLGKKWLEEDLLGDGMLLPFQFGADAYFSFTSTSRHILAPVTECPSPRSKSEALAFAHAMKATRERDSESALQDSIYAEKASRLLPTFSLSDHISDDIVLGFYLSGGVPVSVKSTRRLKSLTTWLGADHLQDVINKAGINLAKASTGGETTTTGKTGKFSLAGRHELEQFLNEHVIDIIENNERYKALGIDFPSAIILHGPPGCGKTFAIEKLVEYLEWPSFNIEASSVASPFIHETSKKVAEVFNNAMQNAPAIIVIDEMEAFLSNRQNSQGHQHHVEEVAEFLRRIPEAIKNQVIVVGMTNCLEMIDPAILRRGRFDHVIKVDMASEQEINDLFNKLVDALPHDSSIDVAPLAKQLKGRPLSDVAFIVRESARLAARSGADKINQQCLVQALESSPVRTGEPPARKIGFM